MDKLLSKIYYGEIDFVNKTPPVKTSKQEQALYDKLAKSLTKEQSKIFQKFLGYFLDRQADYQEYAFKQGVKFGFNLIKEINEI